MSQLKKMLHQLKNQLKITETTSKNTAEGSIKNAKEGTPKRVVEELIEEVDESISVSSTVLKEEENTSLVEGSSRDPEEDHLESAATNLQPGSDTCIVSYNYCSFSIMLSCSSSNIIYYLYVINVKLLRNYPHDYRQGKSC
jgi:hypothetical protein